MTIDVAAKLTICAKIADNVHSIRFCVIEKHDPFKSTVAIQLKLIDKHQRMECRVNENNNNDWTQVFTIILCTTMSHASITCHIEY